MNSIFDPTLLLQITCHDPDEFQEVAIGWDIDHVQLVPGNYRINVDMIHTRNIQFSNITHCIGVQERGCIPPGACAISLPTLLSTYPLYCCGRILQRDECLASMPGDEFETFSNGGINYFTIVVDIDLLNKEAVRLTGHPFSSLVRSQRVTIKKQDQLRLVHTMSTMIQELTHYPHHLTTGKQELLEKQIVEQILLSIRPPSGKKIKNPNRLRAASKAEQLIRQHPRQHLNIQQLCSLIGCSTRTLHLGFKERYGTTPGHYARTLALNAVWRQFRSQPQSRTVTEVAMAWGFYHLGRFSSQYRQLFDELPSVTVKRCRGGRA